MFEKLADVLVYQRNNRIDAASINEHQHDAEGPRPFGVAGYEGAAEHDLSDIARFHRGLELIHPFSDGNGRVGRLIMFKECLRNGIAPFIVTEDLRDFYIRSLREYGQESGYLLDSLGFAQDRFEAVYEPLARDFWSAAMAPNCEKDLDPTRPEPTVADPYSVSAPASSLSLTEATDLR